MIGVRTNSVGARRGLLNIINGLDAAIERGLDKTAERGLKVAQSKSKGSLSKSIAVEKDGNGRRLVARAPYAAYVERGRGPVKAKAGGVLVFVINGRTIFARRVGPARARPFMKPAGVAMSKANDVAVELSKLFKS